MARKRHLRCSYKTKPGTTNAAPVVKVPTKLSTKANKPSSPKSFKPLPKPNQHQSRTLLEKFDGRGYYSLIFSPLKKGASTNPWILLISKESGAVTGSTNVQVVFERMRANVKAANTQIEQFSDKVYAKRG